MRERTAAERHGVRSPYVAALALLRPHKELAAPSKNKLRSLSEFMVRGPLFLVRVGLLHANSTQIP